MNKFKKLIMSGHTQRKEYLHKLYTDRQVYISSVRSSEQPVEDEKAFYYRDIYFKFEGTGYRTMEKMIIFIYVPGKYLEFGESSRCADAYEDFLLRLISGKVNMLSEEYKNDHKSSREKPEFSAQKVNSKVQKRNGCLYVENENCFRLRIHFTAPLINGMNLNGKIMFKAVRGIMEIVSDALESLDKEKLNDHVKLYEYQTEIRNYIKEKDCVAFIGNGSILPRIGETDEPMKNAVPFVSPESMEMKITMRDGKVICGMGIRKGITVITGGGYSGKSTLLDSLEMGIYNHIRGDGREFVISDKQSCKIYAEDGRYIENTDISPFFTDMPGKEDVKNFSTNRASGSVSQAAGIIEAVYGKTDLLMIDEDTSATNFMIRDKNMRMLVKNEPIIPFTDRVEELKSMGISTVLVIGGSSEYLKYADTIVLMEDYTAKDRTAYVKENITANMYGSENEAECVKSEKMEMAAWTGEKHFVNEIKTEFFYSECVQIENARYIRIDDFVSDITKITAVVSDEQINALTYLLEKLLAEENGETELICKCESLVERMFSEAGNAILSNSHKYELWLEDIRPLDLMMTVCRMRKNK